MGKKVKKDESKKALIIIAVLLAFGLGAAFLFTTFLSSGDNSGCGSIADSEERAGCYTLYAKNTGKAIYCTHANYWFDDCLDQADPNRVAEEEDLQAVCEAVVDSSRRMECFEYLVENYE